MPRLPFIQAVETFLHLVQDDRAAVTELSKLAGLKGNKLRPCLKVDECKWVSEKSLERLTLTMLNGGLDEDMQAWWSVQSEKDIWTLGAYEVCVLVRY